MPRESVIPAIKAKLEEYLQGLQAAWVAQGGAVKDRTPTLPATSDEKANVSAIARDIGLNENQKKYLHERQELCVLVNAVALEQGLLPIGARKEKALKEAEKKVDEDLKGRLNRQAKRSRAAESAAIESSAAEQRLLERVAELEERLAKREAHIVRLEARLQMMENGIYVEAT
ncbi:hypothetical protein [Azohydromonas australica]|uniref:hypothetical protein n=1 Tax=Azohydromonas australica TaxID=364039 RepID=UPI0012EC0921|nr:hypothetical protein [Azohydromonas australica]